MISYKYDATGNRIYKKVNNNETHYVRDASGNLMATYENKIAKEFVIYGSSRLGIYNGATSEGKRTLGNKKYELSNHLGNVLSVISDNKIGVDSDADLVADYYEPYIVSESDYYPFGMTMEKRSFASSEYRFGFNTQEKSTELGEDTYTAEFWQYDSRNARRWNVDPVDKSWESSYFAFGGNPIYYVDIEGDDKFTINSDGSIIREENDSKYHEYYYSNDKGTVLLYTAEPNNNDLILLDDFNYDSKYIDIHFSFNVKDGNEYRSYIGANQLASFLGAMAETGENDVTVIGFSESDGSSPSPSTSHVNGRNGDVRYLRTDETGGAIELQEEAFDKDRSQKMINALYNFGWKNILSENYLPYGETDETKKTILDNTTHYDETSRHHNHAHLQGYKPNLTYYSKADLKKKREKEQKEKEEAFKMRKEKDRKSRFFN